ncbi:hypothetical protein RCL1_002346 [Eukaryota sp. TZLM3-RCL]
MKRLLLFLLLYGAWCITLNGFYLISDPQSTDTGCSFSGALTNLIRPLSSSCPLSFDVIDIDSLSAIPPHSDPLVFVAPYTFSDHIDYYDFQNDTLLIPNIAYSFHNPAYFSFVFHLYLDPSLILASLFNMYAEAGATSVTVLCCNMPSHTRSLFENASSSFSIHYYSQCLLPSSRHDFVMDVVPHARDLLIFLIINRETNQFVESLSTLPINMKGVVVFTTIDPSTTFLQSKLVENALFVDPFSFDDVNIPPNFKISKYSASVASTILSKLAKFSSKNFNQSIDISSSLSNFTHHSHEIFDSKNFISASPKFYQYTSGSFRLVTSSRSLAYPSSRPFHISSRVSYPDLSILSLFFSLSLLLSSLAYLFLKRRHKAKSVAFPSDRAVTVFTRCPDVGYLFNTLSHREAEQTLKHLQSLITRVVIEHRGRIVKFFGPEHANSLSVFHNVSDAMRAVVDLQVECVTTEWPIVLEFMEPTSMVENSLDHRIIFRGLKVAIGFDYGEVNLVRTDKKVDYLGTTLNRSARLAQLAAPGQCLCSGDVLTRAGEESFDYSEVATVTHMGERLLKGLARFTTYCVWPISLTDRSSFLLSPH